MCSPKIHWLHVVFLWARPHVQTHDPMTSSPVVWYAMSMAHHPAECSPNDVITWQPFRIALALFERRVVTVHYRPMIGTLVSHVNCARNSNTALKMQRTPVGAPLKTAFVRWVCKATYTWPDIPILSNTFLIKWS